MRRRRHRTAWSALLALALMLGGCGEELAAPTEPLRLLRPTWSEAFAGEPFDGTLRPTGGLRPYRFERVAGALPPGVALQGGRLAGTPTETGRFRFTIAVRDGNLSQALLEMELVVRELPVPVVRVATPATEVRDPLPLVARIEDARGWRGSQLIVRWDAERFALDGDVAPGDPRLAVVADVGDGALRADVVALGAPRDGAFDLVAWTLVPIDPPARVGLEVVATTTYAGGETRTERREGTPTPAAAPASAPPAAAPTEPLPSDPAVDADDEAASEDAGEPETEETP
ncbi:MAG: hypothetical protein P1P87_14480 [Trueperaceae bacterium]|nr:hypothetical protein [Trueperaceae bacterium]